MSLIVHKIPYISQTSNLLKLEGSLTQEEIETWGYNLCGLLCAFMAIKDIKKNTLTLQNILYEAIRIKAYEEKKGWIHQKLVELCSIHGIKAFTKSISDLQLIEHLIKSNRLVIASVSPTYIGRKKSFFFHRKSGHMVLIIGIESVSNNVVNLRIHDPGSRDSEGGEDIALDPHLFEENFSGNIIVINRTNNYE